MSTLDGSANFLPCGRPMRWDTTAEEWRCASHGQRTIESIPGK